VRRLLSAARGRRGAAGALAATLAAAAVVTPHDPAMGAAWSTGGGAPPAPAGPSSAIHAAPAAGAPANPSPSASATAPPPLVAVEALGLPVPEAPQLTAAGAVLWDPADDRVLAGEDAGAARPIASTTKIMTALLALEAGTLEDDVSVSPAAAAAGAAPGVATLGLAPGETVPMADLLAGLVLRSGNDAAVAVAEHVAGSEAAFVQRMNDRAAQLGLTATSFSDASGLSEAPPNRATPQDLARLAEVALADPAFAGWAAAPSAALPSLAPTPLVNRNELIGVYPGATGVKTGFTTLAGQCLVASAQRDGRTLVAVVLGSADRASDAAALLDHGFQDWRRATAADPAAPATRYAWDAATVDVVASEPLAVTLPAGQPATWRAVLDPDVPLPAPAGTPVGRAELVVAGAVVDRSELRTAQPAAAPAPRSAAAAAGGALEDALRAFTRAVPRERPIPEAPARGTLAPLATSGGVVDSPAEHGGGLR